MSEKPGKKPPPMRTALAQPEALIRFKCPRCKKALESPLSRAGEKHNCTGCGQRLQIPHPPKPADPVANKTMLGDVEGAVAAPAPPSAPAPQPSPIEEIPTVKAAPAPPPVRHEYCLECGRD